MIMDLHQAVSLGRRSSARSAVDIFVNLRDNEHAAEAARRDQRVQARAREEEDKEALVAVHRVMAGEGTTHDLRGAAADWREAADRGDAGAQLLTGGLLARGGGGVKKDLPLGKRYLELSAAAGNEDRRAPEGAPQVRVLRRARRAPHDLLAVPQGALLRWHVPGAALAAPDGTAQAQLRCAEQVRGSGDPGWVLGPSGGARARGAPGHGHCGGGCCGGGGYSGGRNGDGGAGDGLGDNGHVATGSGSGQVGNDGDTGDCGCGGGGGNGVLFSDGCGGIGGGGSVGSEGGGGGGGGGGKGGRGGDGVMTTTCFGR